MSVVQAVIDVWYVSIDGQVYKPVAFEKLCKLAHRGRICPTDKVRESGGQWMEAGTLVGLFPNSFHAAQSLTQGTKLSEAETNVIERTNQAICTFWSCRIQGVEYGPVQLETPVNMGVKGELSGNDQVRAENGSWMSAKHQPELRQLFKEGKTSPSQATISNYEITALKAAEVWHNTKKQAQRNAKQTRENLYVKKEASKLDLLKEWCSQPIIMNATCFIVLATVLWAGYSYWNRVPAQAYYDRLVTFKEELDGLRISNCSNADWEKASLRIQSETAPMLQVLKKRASVDRPDLQHLLWATRDALPRMLEDARDNISESELYFLGELEAAEELLN